ncbi:hypothetical protein ACHAWF_016431 [Thalassiosira exigua]
MPSTHRLCAIALDILDAQGYDFSKFDTDADGKLDGFGVLHSGYGAEFGGKDCYDIENINRIWSHKSGLDWTSGDGSVKVDRFYVSSSLRNKCGSDIVRIGVLCHEIGHYLGLPDLYDTTFKGKGLGGFDFMSQSWGLDATGKYPPALSAWSKVKLGWATAETITKDGTYELEVANPESPYKVYKITHNFPEGEYLLFENRQPIGYDSKLNKGGIAIYHVDDTKKGQKNCGFPEQEGWPQNGNHYQIALLAASGNYDLERGKNEGSGADLFSADSKLVELGDGTSFPNTDAYQGGVLEDTGIRIFGFSASGPVMTFQVEGLAKQAKAVDLPFNKGVIDESKHRPESKNPMSEDSLPEPKDLLPPSLMES